MVKDIDRPDINGVPPKMASIAEQAKTTLVGSVPYLNIAASDNIMSSVIIRGTFEPKDNWPSNIFHNASYFIISIVPMSGKRYYEPTDPKVTVKMDSKHFNLPTFRKYTGPVDKCLEKIKTWITNV